MVRQGAFSSQSCGGLHVGSLVGTHAHELMMMTTQLLSQYDDMAGAKSGNPVPVAALLAHLLFLREVGGLAAPTALSDTFGTKAFVEVCNKPMQPCRTKCLRALLQGLLVLTQQR